MAVQLTPIFYSNNDTVITLIELANTIVDILATEVITANNDANGALTIGNAYLSGIFGASILTGGELRGGSVADSANLVLTSNIAGDPGITISIGGNTIINTTHIVAQSLVVNAASIDYFILNNLTVGNTEYTALTYQANSEPDQVFDYFALSQYRSAEYIVSLSDTSPGANAYQTMKILIIHDGGAAYITQYGIVTSNGEVATVNASTNATSVLITVSPVTASNVEVQATRIAMGT